MSVGKQLLVIYGCSPQPYHLHQKVTSDYFVNCAVVPAALNVNANTSPTGDCLVSGSIYLAHTHTHTHIYRHGTVHINVAARVICVPAVCRLNTSLKLSVIREQETHTHTHF